MDSAGSLELYIKSGPGTGSGRELFAEAMEHFGDGVKQIEGNWHNIPGLSSNYDSYWAARARGFSPELAVFETFTGREAQRYGFNVVDSIEIGWEEVFVIFRR